jgi:general stress protein 26
MPSTTQPGFQKLMSMIEALDFGMLTTMDEDNNLRSRPMSTQKAEDGVLWFLTSASTPKADEIKNESDVNISYADPSTQTYISVSGKASTSKDKKQIRAVWNDDAKQWFPKGIDDPDLAVIKVKLVKAEYWDIDQRGMQELLKQGAEGEELDQAIDHKKIA